MYYVPNNNYMFFISLTAVLAYFASFLCFKNTFVQITRVAYNCSFFLFGIDTLQTKRCQINNYNKYAVVNMILCQIFCKKQI